VITGKTKQAASPLAAGEWAGSGLKQGHKAKITGDLEHENAL
jgi:hypothetical protein